MSRLIQLLNGSDDKIWKFPLVISPLAIVFHRVHPPYNCTWNVGTVHGKKGARAWLGEFMLQLPVKWDPTSIENQFHRWKFGSSQPDHGIPVMTGYASSVLLRTYLDHT